MAHITREISDEQCQWFEDDVKSLLHEFDRLLSRHAPLSESVWLGGDRDADNTEKGPNRTTKAMGLLRQAQSLVQEADHLVAMYRATGDAVDE